MPPSCSVECALGHDMGMQRTMDALMGGLPGNEAQVTEAKTLATLPMRMGGLGFRSTERMAPSAFWASWADALPMIADRLPQVAGHVVGAVTNEEVPTGCLGELKDAAAQLDRAGFVLRPGWAALRDGARLPVVSSAETGEWQHGWQYHASSASEHHFLENHGAVTCVPSRSGSLAVTLRTRVQQYPPGSSNQLRIQIDSGALQDLGVGEVAAPTVSGGSQVRVRNAAGQSGETQGCVPPFGNAKEESSGPGENLGKGVQGGRSHSEVQRQVE